VAAHVLALRRKEFLLWRPARTEPPPSLVIGRLQSGAPVTLAGERSVELSQSAHGADLWSVEARRCGLEDGQVYHYWFEVTDAHPARSARRIRVTDPWATMVDWRLRAPQPPGHEYSAADRYPAAVVRYRDGALEPCDPGGETGEMSAPALSELPPNNRIVLYELPTAWAATGADGVYQRGVGTFRDVAALVDRDAAGADFAGRGVTAEGRSYLVDELGINALELLPPADSAYVRTWGYGTTNFAAPDMELGYPLDSSHPTPNRDLRALVTTLHRHGVRFFVDSVTAFARDHPYLAVATDDFFILDPATADPSDPDRYDSRGGERRGFGSSLFRYETHSVGYDPLTGTQRRLSPASALVRSALVRWMQDFAVDGIRMDSIENVFSWDFVGAYRDLARSLFLERSGAPAGDREAEARFLVVGEELTEPLALVTQHRLDGLWHEGFKRYARAAVLGRGTEGLGFVETVRRMIDCRACGYDDLAQAVIYLTSHDVEGFGNERLYDYLQANGVRDCEKRIKLAFACLLTAVGIPQILAGDEFADQHDLFDASGHVSETGGKQVDPVNYSRLDDDWRSRVKDHVGRLVRLRTTADALAVNDVEVLHADLDGKRVVVWRRGRAGSDQQVVVVANFSDYTTPSGPFAEYVVPSWPPTPPGRRWREVTQARDVPPEWVGREPIFPWEAKVYSTT
jgi:pullulanase